MVAAPGCSDDTAACLAGARVCEGETVLQCVAEVGDFVALYTCEDDQVCVTGACVQRSFEGDADRWREAPQDAVEDGGGQDPGDVAAPLPDPGPVDTAPDEPDEWTAPELPEPDEWTAPGPDEWTAPEPDEVTPPEPDEVTSPELPELPEPPDHGPAPDQDVPVDVGPAADHGAPPPEVPFAPDTHLPTYEPLGNIWVQGDLHSVRWHPSGDYALLAAPGGELLRYDAETGGLSLPASVPGSVADLEVDPAGGFFLAAGHVDEDGKLWKITPGEDGAFDVTEEAAFPEHKATCVAADPTGTSFAVGTWYKLPTGYIDTIHLWRDGPGITTSAAFNGPGLTDLMWADPALYAGSDAIVTGEGLNGAGSHTYVVASDMTIGNGWKASFGNPGGAGWRPGGAHGMFTAFTTNKLYVFDGSWTMATLPGVPTGGSPNAIGWKPDGTRALIVGRAVGSPLEATVVEYRPLDQAGWQPSALLDVSIQGFGDPPWNGNSNLHLQGIDWRPSSDCDEGLIVGSDTGTAWSPTFGTVIRFVDPDDPGCDGAD